MTSRTRTFAYALALALAVGAVVAHRIVGRHSLTHRPTAPQESAIAPASSPGSSAPAADEAARERGLADAHRMLVDRAMATVAQMKAEGQSAEAIAIVERKAREFALEAEVHQVAADLDSAHRARAGTLQAPR